MDTPSVASLLEGAKQAEPLLLGEPRQLSLADAEAPAERAKPDIQRISYQHHGLARLLAQGTMTLERASVACGYSPGRASQLLQSETFKTLVATYQQAEVDEHERVQAMLHNLTGSAASELLKRMEDDPEQFTNPQLLELTTKLGDRSGHGPSQEVQVQVSLADAVEAGRARALARGRTLEGEYTEGEAA